MSRPSNRAIGTGALAGLLSFLVGYLATWILAGARAANLSVSGPFGGGVPDWKAVLWVFFDAHFVGTETPRVVGPGGVPWGGGDLVDTVGLLGVEYMYVVPLIVLILAGAAVTSRVPSMTGRQATLTGMTLVAGYLPAAVLGLLLGTESGVAPSALRAVVLAGFLYPIACGAIGGYLWARRQGRES